MRDIKFIVVHSADTVNKEKYHYIIDREGIILVGAPVEKSCRHTRSFNKTSISICVIGKNLKDGQVDSLRKLISSLRSKHQLSMIDVVEHKDLERSVKCPKFNLNEVILKA